MRSLHCFSTSIVVDLISVIFVVCFDVSRDGFAVVAECTCIIFVHHSKWINYTINPDAMFFK